MNVMKKIALKVGSRSSINRAGEDEDEEPAQPPPKMNYKRRFSMPYGKIVDTWQRDNVMPAMPEEEYPIYQSASFRRHRRHSVVCVEEPVEPVPPVPSHLKDSILPSLNIIQPASTSLQVQWDPQADWNDDADRRPSLAELQAEDRERRPSITMYQSVDSQHPDVLAIQKLVEKMKFGELQT